VGVGRRSASGVERQPGSITAASRPAARLRTGVNADRSGDVVAVWARNSTSSRFGVGSDSTDSHHAISLLAIIEIRGFRARVTPSIRNPPLTWCFASGPPGARTPLHGLKVRSST
jgi:hypothetical protein